MKILKLDDLDSTNFVYSEPKINAMGGQSVYIGANSENDKIVIQTPKCALPFGLNSFQPNNGDVKYSLDFSLRGNHAIMQNFTGFLQKFDDRNTEVAVEKSKEWFKKQLDQSVIDEIYRNTLKTQKNYAPIIKVKVPTKQGKFLGDIFDQNKNKVDLESIQKGSTVQAIIECVGMYFIAKEFGITWKVVQLKVYPPNKLNGYSFVDDNSEEEVEPVN
tara:strand:- start:1980 stop:2630 length:651 start_codon:yes stop_codon:yes gene_type:complete